MVKVSVIIPIYNASTYLQECLDSVINQTLWEIEIICVDDGSTDLSCKQVYDYQKKDSRIFLFKRKHEGAGAARNYGMLQSKGEYITFLDSDDYYYDMDALEHMYNAVKTYGSVIGTAFKKIMYQGQLQDDLFLRDLSCSNNSPRWIDFKEYQSDFNFQCYIYQRSFLKQNSIRFPLYLRYQDPPFLLNTIVQVKKILLIPINFYCQRYSEQSRMLNGQQVYDLLCGIYDNMKMSVKYGYNGLYIKQISRVNYRYYKNIINNLSSDVIRILATIEKFHQERYMYNPIKPLQEMRRCIMQQKCDKFLFPFHLLQHNDNFVIYGAGVMGHALYYQWCHYGSKFGTLVAVVDRNAEQMKYNEFQVFPPDILNDLDFDVILIAIKNSLLLQEVMQYLIGIGIPTEKIRYVSEEET